MAENEAAGQKGPLDWKSIGDDLPKKGACRLKGLVSAQIHCDGMSPLRQKKGFLDHP